MRNFIRIDGTRYYTSNYIRYTSNYIRDNQRPKAIVKAIGIGLLCLFIALIIK